MAKNLLLWLVIAAVLLSIFNNFSMQSPTERMVYSEFIQEIQRDQVRKVTIDGLTIYGERLDGSRFETTRPMLEDPQLIDDLLSHSVSSCARCRAVPAAVAAMSFGKSKARCSAKIRSR
jgi:cell division protease FtsH